MMATPLSWNSWILWPSFTGKSTVKRRFCLVELRYTGSMILAVSVTELFVVKKIIEYLGLLTICLLNPPEPSKVQVGGNLAGYCQLVVPAHSA